MDSVLYKKCLSKICQKKKKQCCAPKIFSWKIVSFDENILFFFGDVRKTLRNWYKSNKEGLKKKVLFTVSHLCKTGL